MELYAFSRAWGALAIELTLAVGFRCGGRNAMVANCQLLACADVCDATNESDEPAGPVSEAPLGAGGRQSGRALSVQPVLAWPGFSLDFSTLVTIIVGENGTGKSTLVEALAAMCGYDEAGGGKG